MRGRILTALRAKDCTDSDLKSIKMKKENGEAAFAVAYERRGPMSANPHISATFDESMR